MSREADVGYWGNVFIVPRFDKLTTKLIKILHFSWYYPNTNMLFYVIQDIYYQDLVIVTDALTPQNIKTKNICMSKIINEKINKSKSFKFAIYGKEKRFFHILIFC